MNRIRLLFLVCFFFLFEGLFAVNSHADEVTIEIYGGEYSGEASNGAPHGQGTWTNPNGTKYIGEWKDGLPNGQGTFSFPDGAKHIGEFKDGKRHGQGTSTYANASKYIGEWQSDKRHGQGTFIYPNGAKYVGEFKDELFNGQGTYTFPDGSKYVGEWKDDKRNGQGAYTSAIDGSEYVGEFKDDKKHGQGTWILPSGSKYVGEWQGNKRQGQGSESYPDGSKYIGEWKDGKKHGQGTYTNADGYKFVGEWQGNRRQGQGSESNPDGSKYIGEWKDDKKHGQGSWSDPDGTKYVGEWIDNTRHGLGAQILPDESKYVGNWKDNTEHGWGAETYPDGTKYVGEFKDGKKHGQGTQNGQGWSGNLELKAAFEEGWLDRMTTPVPSRLSCKGKTLYRVQPDLSTTSYVHEKETLEHSTVDLDLFSGLATFKPQGNESPKEDWFSGGIKQAGGSQLIIGWGGGQYSSLNFSVLGGELVLVENMLYDNKTYSDTTDEYVYSETIIYLCEASTLDESFHVWLKELGRATADMIIPMYASALEVDVALLKKNSVECLDQFVEEAFPLFSDELKVYLSDLSIDDLMKGWEDLDPVPPSEWPIEMTNQVSYNFGECIGEGVREPKPVTPEFVQQLTESCVSTPLPTVFFPDPSQTPPEAKLEICNCLTQLYIDLGLDGNAGTNWNAATGTFSFEFGFKNPERVGELMGGTTDCYELKVDPNSTNPNANSDSQGPNPNDLQSLMESGQCENCMLSNADLRNFRLDTMEIEHSELAGANMSGLILDILRVENSDLSNAVLSDITARIGVTFFRTNLSNADISRLRCEEETWCVMPNFMDSNLTGADLSGSILKGGAMFDSANLTNTDLSGSDLVDAMFMGATLEHTDLSNSNLTGAEFEGDMGSTKVFDVSFRNSNLTKASFRDAVLIDGDFTGAILCRTIMPDGKRNDSGCP